MELFLVLVLTAVYGPLLLLLSVARRDGRLASMERSARLANSDRSSLKVASLNIRFSPPNQNQRQPGQPEQEFPWAMRREAVVDQLLYERPDIFCLQEVMAHQLEDIDLHLGSIYGHVAAGREDGYQQGEATPVFWNKDRFELLNYEHFWLSETPHVPGSVGWDAALSRIATLTKLRWRHASPPAEKEDSDASKEDDEVFYVLNTHYDHIGYRARAESSKLIMFKLKDIMGTKLKGRSPLVIMTGDLNSPPNESGYQVITGHRYTGSGKQADANAFYDTRHELLTRNLGSSLPLQRNSYGSNSTFTDFRRNAYKAYIIDFVLVAANGAVRSAEAKNDAGSDAKSWAVTRHGVLPNLVEDGQYPFRLSDHNMVTALLTRAQ